MIEYCILARVVELVRLCCLIGGHHPHFFHQMVENLEHEISDYERETGRQPSVKAVEVCTVFWHNKSLNLGQTVSQIDSKYLAVMKYLQDNLHSCVVFTVWQFHRLHCCSDNIDYKTHGLPKRGMYTCIKQ